jgi:uncharacterized protein (TIGR02996 family)
MPSPSAEYDALYAAVCAAPDDDTPRLVLADWLDEHDDPHRAAFIRASVQLAQMQEADPHAAAVYDFRSATHYLWQSYADAAAISPAVGRMAELTKQAKASESKAAARWKAVLGKRKVGLIHGYVRGFPYHIIVSNARQYATRAGPENLPGYSLYVFYANEPGLDELLATRNFAAATGFELSSVDSPDSVRKLGARPAVRNFRSLHLSLESDDGAILAAVATQPNWSGLTSLELDSYVYQTRSRLDLPKEFARAKHLRALTDLTVVIEGLSGAGLGHLAKLGLPKLRKLNVHLNKIDAAGAKTLATGDFPELRYLDLEDNKIGNGGAAALAGCKRLTNLAALNLAGNGITDRKVLSSLIAGPAFPVLAGLSVAANPVRELDAKILAAPGRGPTLRLLSLQSCKLSAKAVAALASAPSLVHLVALDLAYNQIGDAGAAAIADSKWDRLTCLDLAGNGITGKGVKALVAWPGLANLAYLDLRGNPIGLAGAKALAGCDALKKCRKIVVPGVGKELPAAGYKLLKKTFGRRL